MAANIKSEELFLIRKFLVLVPGSDRLPPRCGRSVSLLIEKRNLSGCPIALCYRRRIQRFFDAREEFCPIPARKIERARLDEALQHFAVGYPRIEPRTKILERTELAA